MVDLSKVLDDHLDKEKRKANVVVHNLPEQVEGTVTEKCEKDSTSFVTMIKSEMKINATVSKSFRAGKKLNDKPRLLIITLDNPAVKQDILRYAPQLRHSDQYSNIYITPDLTQKEREANRKLREELASRRRSGEVNLMIKGGKIISTNKVPALRQEEPISTRHGEAKDNWPAQVASSTGLSSSTASVVQDRNVGTMEPDNCDTADGDGLSAAVEPELRPGLNRGEVGGPVDRPAMVRGPGTAAVADPEVVAALDCGRDHTSLAQPNAASVGIKAKQGEAVTPDSNAGSSSLGQPGVATGSGHSSIVQNAPTQDVCPDQAAAEGKAAPLQSASVTAQTH